MAAPIKIILIVACACLADCRLSSRSHKIPSPLEDSRKQEVTTNSNTDHKTIAVKDNGDDRLRTPEHKSGYNIDAIVFPSDEERVYPEANKILTKIPEVKDKKENNDSRNISNDNAESVAVPLLSIVVPPIEPKAVFTNPITANDQEVTSKPLDLKHIEENIQEKEIKATIENENTTLHVIDANNNTLNSNETVPDFSSRFGVTNSYMLVPVNNVQSYQPIQTVPNGIPVSNIGSQYTANYDQSNNNPLVNGANSYAPLNANVASNIGTNPEYIAPNPNITPMYTNANAIGANNANYNSNLAYPQGNGNFVPINVPNTYMINGQLYAAVTVPNNVNVPNSLYFVNPQPQPSGYQVANNVPLYQLVANPGDQRNAKVGAIY